MNKVRIIALFFVCFCLVSGLGMSSNLNPTAPTVVSGRVTIWGDIPLENIKVTASKSEKEAISNEKGEFSIEVGNKDKLRFTAVGFVTQKVSVKGLSKEMHVEMELLSNDFSEEGEQVNNGFRYIPQAYRTTAIKRLKKRHEQEFASYNSVWDIIRGRIAGVVVLNNNAYFREGLSGSVGVGSTPAFIVLNGSRVSSSTITNLDPHNVKDVNLLKGAAASVYGGSGGAGVIVITTK